MNLIKKILPLVLAVGLLFGSCISVSAAETITPQNLKYIENVDLSKWSSDYPTDYVLICKKDGYSENYCVLLSSIPFQIKDVFGEVGSRSCYANTGSDYYYGYGRSLDSITFSQTNCLSIVPIDNASMYTSHNLYIGDDLVFWVPATPLVQVAMEITPVMILREILNLLPIVIVVVVGYLGLRKALSILFSRLRKA